MSRPRRVHLFFAVLFYGFLGAAGAIWIRFSGVPVKLHALFSADNRPLTYALGIGGGLAVAALSWLAVKVSARARMLEQEFGNLLSHHSVLEIAVLALLSGIAEEIFFRGAVQQWIGPLFGAIVFALAHPPFTRRLILWPVFALFVGLMFAYQFEWTGNLIAPVLSHTIINFVNLLRICARYRLLQG